MFEITLNPDLNHFPVPIGFCINWIHESNYTKTYALQCPTCNKPFCLANHSVMNGIVSPSVVCPFNCGFHVMMKING